MHSLTIHKINILLSLHVYLPLPDLLRFGGCQLGLEMRYVHVATQLPNHL